MLERSLMTKRYAVPAFSLVTFLPFMVSPIVKPGPTVPFTVFAGAAEPLPETASAAAATTAPRNNDFAPVIHLMPFASLGESDGRIVEGRDGDSHRGDPPDFSATPPSTSAALRRRDARLRDAPS